MKKLHKNAGIIFVCKDFAKNNVKKSKIDVIDVKKNM